MVSELIEREAVVLEAEAVGKMPFGADESFHTGWDQCAEVLSKRLQALPVSTRYAELERAARELSANATIWLNDSWSEVVDAYPEDIRALRTALANLDKEQGNE